MAHTPGPWTQGTSKHGRECVWINGHKEPDYGVMGPEKTWIDCNIEDDARLIAAAPELLEALIGVLSLDEDHQRGADDEDVCYEVQAARAAIAKATGEQP